MSKVKRIKNIKKPKSLMGDHKFKPPVIPNKIVWTASSLKLFRRCPRMWYWKYIMRLKPLKLSSALYLGTAAHESLEMWYKGKRSKMSRIINKTLAKANEEYLKTEKYYDQNEADKATTSLQTFTGMMMGYEGVYQSERNEWNIERENIERQFFADMGDFFFSGKIDLIAALKKRVNKGKNFIVEHKTAASIPGSYIERLPLDNQVKAYSSAARDILGMDITHVVYDVIKKCKLRRKANESITDFNQRIEIDYMSRPSFYFFREKLKISKNDTRQFYKDMCTTHSIYNYIINSKNPLDPGSWPMNDHAYTEFFTISEYSQLSVEGLNRGTSLKFYQDEFMHPELGDISKPKE